MEPSDFDLVLLDPVEFGATPEDEPSDVRDHRRDDAQRVMRVIREDPDRFYARIHLV